MMSMGILSPIFPSSKSSAQNMYCLVALGPGPSSVGAAGGVKWVIILPFGEQPIAKKILECDAPVAWVHLVLS